MLGIRHFESVGGSFTTVPCATGIGRVTINESVGAVVLLDEVKGRKLFDHNVTEPVGYVIETVDG